MIISELQKQYNARVFTTVTFGRIMQYTYYSKRRLMYIHVIQFQIDITRINKKVYQLPILVIINNNKYQMSCVG